MSLRRGDWGRGSVLLGTAVLGLVAAASTAAGADEPAVQQAAERDAKALDWLLRQGLRALSPAIDPPPDRQRQEQIDKQAKQMERFFQPLLASELELIRQCCGGLEPAARQRLLNTGRGAVAVAARGFAERQLTGRLGQDAYDPREEIRQRLTAAMLELATPAESAAYQAAVAERQARHAEAARVAIVARLDRQLDLTAAQRQAIEAHLDRAWESDWGRELDRRGQMRLNGYPIAPDEAAAAILPHLDPAQVAEWQQWCRAAGSRMMPKQFNLSFDGQGLQQPDRWWGR
jgi:hypothetical protein